MTTIDATTLETFRQRRSLGARVSDLAAEIGFTPWQKLDKLLRHGFPKHPKPVDEPAPIYPLRLPAEALTRAYQPRSIADILGQPAIRAALQAFVERPRPAAMLFTGDTGVGKTTAALALAAGLGCDLDPSGIGGVRVIASGEQTADSVRDAICQLHYSTLRGSGWKVVIVNEADRMHPAAETIWLDALETLPPKSVIVFTTNYAEKLPPRFRDRCMALAFSADPDQLAADARRLLSRIWRDCTGRDIPGALADRLVAGATSRDAFSYRRLLQAAECEMLLRGQPPDPPADGVRDEEMLFPEKELPFNLVQQCMPPTIPSMVARAAAAQARREHDARTPALLADAAGRSNPKEGGAA